MPALDSSSDFHLPDYAHPVFVAFLSESIRTDYKRVRSGTWHLCLKHSSRSAESAQDLNPDVDSTSCGAGVLVYVLPLQASSFVPRRMSNEQQCVSLRS